MDEPTNGIACLQNAVCAVFIQWIIQVSRALRTCMLVDELFQIILFLCKTILMDCSIILVKISK